MLIGVVWFASAVLPLSGLDYIATAAPAGVAGCIPDPARHRGTVHATWQSNRESVVLQFARRERALMTGNQV
jgi:hypothetical protein